MFIKDILIRQKDNKKVAVEFGNSTITYCEMFNKVEKNYKTLEFKKGDMNNIAIFLPNSTKYCIGYFTIAFLDKVIVPIDIQIKGPQIQSTIEYCEIRLIITDSEYKEKLKRLIKTMNYKIAIYDLDDNSIEEFGGDNFVKLTERVEQTISEDDCAIMLHTSGTTSNPKRVMLTHKNLIRNIQSNILSLKLTSDDKCIIFLPMFFGYCNTSQYLTHFYLGASIVINDKIFMPESFLKTIQDKRGTNTTCVPYMLLLLAIYNKHNKYDISSLRYLCFGGGIMPVEQLKKVIIKFPTIGFVQTYGQTEASPRVTCLMPEDSLRKLGSVGKSIPNVTVRIVNEAGNDLKPGEIGEIIVQGENVMKGYYKKPIETSNVKKNGWLYTGDLGKFDEEGYIYLVGRRKNVIISGGLNIYPEEIEELLINHPHIKEVCVVGERHDFLGEVPIAKVVLNKEMDPIGEHELLKYCSEHMETYKVPNKIIFLKNLEKTATGKIKRN